MVIGLLYKCNRTGFCSRCTCVKAGKCCESCLPGRLGNCKNKRATASSVAFNTEHNTAASQPSSLSNADNTVSRNTCAIPFGREGRNFVAQLSRLYLAFGSNPSMEIVALKAATVLPILLLQKRSKTKDHTICLRRRLARWSKVELVREGRVIQERLPKPGPSTTNDNLAQNFAKLMFTGKCTAALDLLTIDTNSSNSPTVRDVLISKHPIGQPAHNSCIVLSDPEDPHPVIFESIDADTIRSASLKVKGAAGHEWRGLLMYLLQRYL